MLDKLKGRKKLTVPGSGYVMWSDVTGFLVETLIDVKWEKAGSWKYLMSVRPDKVSKGNGSRLLKRFLLEIGDNVGVVTLIAPYAGTSPAVVQSFLVKFGFIKLKRDGWMIRYPASVQKRKTPEHPFTGGVSKKQTKKHRLAIWESMLGAVYARNSKGEVKYFDYDWDAARLWAGVDLGRDDQDLRVAKYQRHAWKGPIESEPRNGQKVLWIRDNK